MKSSLHWQKRHAKYISIQILNSWYRTWSRDPETRIWSWEKKKEISEGRE